MRKTKKTLAVIALVAMVLTMIPLQVFADTASSSSRLGGTDRIDTAIKIADAGFTSASTVIVAPADDANMVDALAAASLAGTKSPILLTFKSGLDPRVQAEITKLGATKVELIGAAANSAVANALTGVTVDKLAGASRQDTANLINAKLSNPAGTFVVGYDAVPDALSAASYAAANNYAIVLANPDGSVDTSKLVGSKTYVVGGTGVVKDVAGATRLGGADRFATNAAVVGGLSYKYDKVYVANGLSMVDALVAAPLAAKANAAVLLTDGSSVAANVKSSLTASSAIVPLGGSAVVSDAVASSVVTGTAPAPAGPVTVTSVSATGANAIKVKLSAAPADATKISFAVTNNSAPVTVTASWDSTGTVATLTGAANFPEGTYSVDVKNGSTDLGTNTVSITQQKIAQINITSTKLAVVTTGSGNNSHQYGYATFKVLDQYGNDITGGYLANNITFQSGVGSSSIPSTGVLKIDPGDTNLLTFANVVITAYDTSSGVSTSATLATSTAMGTLSSITLNKMTSATNAVLTAGDTADTWYIDYSAKDMSGNDTKDYNLVSGGLILTGDNSDELSSSNPDVTAKVVKDPNDNNKAAIQVTVDEKSIQMDMPVTITAMCYQGNPSSLSLTLKKQSAVDSFTLMAPSFSIASGEKKQIPFVAYDQAGVQMTKYSDIVGDPNKPNITITAGSGDYEWQDNPDGTASLFITAIDVNGSQSVPMIVTAVTPTGKLSSLTLNVQPGAKADTLALASSSVISALQPNANERFDFGINYGGLTVNDQYGRAMDMTAAVTGTPAADYEVVATTSTTSPAISLQTINYNKYNKVTTDPDDGSANVTAALAAGGFAESKTISSGTTSIQVLANNLADNSSVNRTQTVTFSLIKKANLQNFLAGDTTVTVNNVTEPVVLDSQSATFTVVKDSDITDYSIDSVSKPIYAFSTTIGALITSQQEDWSANPYIWGKTSGGAKVKLADFQGTTTAAAVSLVQGVYVDNSTDFSADLNSTPLPSNNINITKVSLYPGVTNPVSLYDTKVKGSKSANYGAYDSVKVAALKYSDSSKTSSSTNLTVSIMGADNKIHTVSTPIQSTSANSVAASVGINYDESQGMHLSDDGKTIYIDNSTAMGKELRATFTDAAETTPTSLDGNGNPVLGTSLQRNDANGAHANRAANIYFYAKDNYGSKGENLANVYIQDYGTVNGSTMGDPNNVMFAFDTKSLNVVPYSVGYNGLTYKGDYVILTGVTANGLIATYTIVNNYGPDRP